jgi:hypothetical protein
MDGDKCGRSEEEPGPSGKSYTRGRVAHCSAYSVLTNPTVGKLLSFDVTTDCLFCGQATRALRRWRIFKLNCRVPRVAILHLAICLLRGPSA